jgi:hypothetical protein
MNRTPRNLLLLAQLSETNPFKKELAPRIFEIGAAFDRDMEAIAQDRRWSEEGRKEKAKARRQEALRDLDNARKPIDDHRRESERMHSAMKVPSYDKSDSYAQRNRHRMLDRSLAMTPGQRAGLMTGKTRSIAFVDALYEFKDDPWMAGINIHDPGEREIFEAAIAERRRDLNPELVPALEARAGNDAEILMVLNIVTNDIQGDGAYRAEIQTARDAYVAAATA